MRSDDLERRLERMFTSPPQHETQQTPSPLPVAQSPEHIRPLTENTPSASAASSLQDRPPSIASTDTDPDWRTDPVAGNPSALKPILDQIPDPIFVKDRGHQWVVVNPAFCRLVGRAEDQLLNRTEGAVFAHASAEEAWHADDRVFGDGQAYTVEQAVEFEDGRVQDWRVSRQLLPSTNGYGPYLVGTVQDVTEHKQVERELHDTESRFEAERSQLEERLRKLKRGLLVQFGFLGIVAALSVSLWIAADSPSRVSAVAADTPTHAVALMTTTSEALSQVPATPTPQATATETHLPSITPSPTIPQPVFTVAPTVAPQAAADGYAAPPAPAPLREFGPNVMNIVLMGSDRRPGDGAWRTDVIILVSVDPDVPSVTMLSFPRDLWVYIPDWRWQRINLADERGESSGFPGGGPALIKQTIQYNFGIPVHYYARVDFSGYKSLIDSVGGVDVVADCTLYDIFPDVPDGANDIISGPELYSVVTGTIDIPVAGVYHLDGKHALWYSRSRKTTSDFDRSRRQQRVLRALWNEVRAQGLLGQVPQLWDTFTKSVETDLTLNDVVYLADVGSRLSTAHIRSRFIDGSMLTWHVTETGANVLLYAFGEIKSYLDETFAPLPRNIAAQAPALVDVINHTSHPDWERVAADRLGWAGYSVKSWSADGVVEPHTTIVDYTLTAKGSRVDALAELFQVPPEHIVRRPNPNSPVAYRVIVGEDFDPCQRPSRGRWPAPPPTPVPTTEATPTS